jgi:hypothetical protein
MLSFLPIVFSVIALSLGAPGNIYCQTFSFTDENNSDNKVFVGIFGYRSKDALYVEDSEGDIDIYVRTYCAPYNDLTDYFGFEYDVDTKWTATKAFAIISITLGVILSIVSCITQCFSVNPKLWKLLGVGFLLVCLFQGLSLLSDVCTDNPVINALESTKRPRFDFNFPQKCDWEVGYKLMISSVALWFLAAITVLLLPAPTAGTDPFESPQQQQAAYDAKVVDAEDTGVVTDKIDAEETGAVTDKVDAEETGVDAEKVDAEETGVEAEEVDAGETGVEAAK